MKETVETILNMTRNQRLKKFRDARKLKNNCVSQFSTQNDKGQNQKKTAKKLRNREAAQRARDKARMKVQVLQKQIKLLKLEAEQFKKRIITCQNCGKKLKQEQLEKLTKTIEQKHQNFQDFSEEDQNNLQFNPFIRTQRVINQSRFTLSICLMIGILIFCILGGIQNRQENSIETIELKHKPRLLFQIYAQQSQPLSLSQGTLFLQDKNQNYDVLIVNQFRIEQYFKTSPISSNVDNY